MLAITPWSAPASRYEELWGLEKQVFRLIVPWELRERWLLFYLVNVTTCAREGKVAAGEHLREHILLPTHTKIPLLIPTLNTSNNKTK